MKDVDFMIEKLLDMDIVTKENIVEFTDEAKQLIHEISEECKTMRVFEKNRHKIAGYSRGLSAEDVYVDMLHKIVEAPTNIHILMSARLLIPIIDQKLQGGGKRC